MRTMLQEEFKSSGYNLRRITRDQTQKLNADLTEQLRQGSVGRFTDYDLADLRRRKSQAKPMLTTMGKTFAWA